MIADIEKMGKVLLEVVDLHQKTEEDLRELTSYKQNRETLMAELAAKEAEGKSWDGRISALKAEHSRFKQGHEAYKEKTISNTRMELEQQRAELVKVYSKDMGELEASKVALTKEVNELKFERENIKTSIESLTSRRQTILHGLEA